MRTRIVVALAALATSLTLLHTSGAAAQEGEKESVAMEESKGFHLGLGPELLLPTESGRPPGGGAVFDGRYGIKAGPLVLAPGGRLAGYIISERFVGTAMPTFRITVPIGFLAPFGEAGIGGGWLSNHSESGLALLAGGGLMIHFGHFVAIGAEVTWQRITGTEFQEIGIGPSIHFGG